MNKPKPKFCVDEEVAVTNAVFSRNNVSRTEIIKVEWCKWHSDGHQGWGYNTTECHRPASLREKSIRKLPPEDRTQWSDCEWMPRETVK